MRESKAHGWPSFRDEEVVWDNVRVLEGGETVSLAGTHLGHNLPDGKGNRYCINLCCVAGRPREQGRGRAIGSEKWTHRRLALECQMICCAGGGC